jgi:hypothetical protein
MNARGSRSVLLLGSVPLKSPTAVFEAVAAALGGLVRRIPDGETGERLFGITFQGERVRGAKGVDLLSERTMLDGTRRPVLAAKPGASTAAVKFAEAGYAEAALKSYAEFARLREAGTIPADVRFQVSLPTPIGVIFGFFAPSSVRTVWPAYERRILLELDRIVHGIPPHDLAVQFDISTEIARILEFDDVAKNYPAEELARAVARVSDNVPPEIELGLHLCYGDMGHRHLVEPRDSRLMVEFANELAATIERPITWLHLPVPRDRDDDDYFAPLRELQLKPETELYLGLVHMTDGIEGAKRRVAAAKRAVTDFGIAAECGLGRRPPETIPALLALHRAVAELDTEPKPAPPDEPGSEPPSPDGAPPSGAQSATE